MQGSPRRIGTQRGLCEAGRGDRLHRRMGGPGPGELVPVSHLAALRAKVSAVTCGGWRPRCLQ